MITCLFFNLKEAPWSQQVKKHCLPQEIQNDENKLYYFLFQKRQEELERRARELERREEELRNAPYNGKYTRYQICTVPENGQV